MILPLQNFSALLQNMSAGLQGGAAQVVDLSVGSVLRALLEANASVALWMQWLILQVLSMTRAATSVGPDLDSWMADFSMIRLPGAPSRGSVTFGRYTVGIGTIIPVGSVVRTVDGSQSFAVVEDRSNPAWDGKSAYYVAPEIANVVLPVQANLPGLIGNVVVGAIGLLGTAIAGVDYVTNMAALYNGADSESDAALRSRFRLYVNSRSLGTVNAVGAAIQSIQQGLRYCVLENVDLNGNHAQGNFCVIVDDGSGSANGGLLAAVSAAVDLVRPIGCTFSVTGPSDVNVSIQMSVTTSSGLYAPALSAKIQQAILFWVKGLPIGATLALSKLESIAHATDNVVLSVFDTQLNGGGADIHAPAGAVFVPGVINVSVS